MPDERAELIAALHQLTAFTEGLLTLSERLVRAYDTHARPSAEELDGVVRWRDQLEGFSSGSPRQPPWATDHYHFISGALVWIDAAMVCRMFRAY